MIELKTRNYREQKKVVQDGEETFNFRARKLISAVAVRLLFEQNDDQVRNEFLRLVNPILERGLLGERQLVALGRHDVVVIGWQCG